MKKIIFMISLLTLVLFSNACKENSSETSPVDKNYNSFVQAMTGDLQQVPYQIFLYKSKSSLLIPDKDTVYKVTTEVDDLNYAFLFDDAGTVKVNNIELPRTSVGTYNIFDPVFNLSTSSINVNVSGSSVVPALNAKVSNPQAFAEVLSPAHGERVSSKNDLDIVWTPVDSSKMIVVIDVESNNPATGVWSFKQFTTDDIGKFRVNSSILSQMQKGIGSITLRRGYANVIPNLGRGYAIIAFTQHTLQFYLD